MYGEPYTLEEVWVVVDKNFKEVGTYKTLDEFKEKYSNEINGYITYSNNDDKTQNKVTDKEIDNSYDSEKNINKSEPQNTEPPKGTNPSKETTKKSDITEKNATEKSTETTSSTSQSTDGYVPSTNARIKFYDTKNTIWLTEDHVLSAEPGFVTASADGVKVWYVTIYLNEKGKEQYAKASETVSKYPYYDEREISISVDGSFLGSPRVTQRHETLFVRVSGGLSEYQANYFAEQIMKIIAENTTIE